MSGVNLIAALGVGDMGSDLEALVGIARRGDRADRLGVLVHEDGVGGVDRAALETLAVSKAHVVDRSVGDSDRGEFAGALVDGSGFEGEGEGGGPHETVSLSGVSAGVVASGGRPSMSRTSSTVRNPSGLRARGPRIGFSYRALGRH